MMKIYQIKENFILMACCLILTSSALASSTPAISSSQELGMDQQRQEFVQHIVQEAHRAQVCAQMTMNIQCFGAAACYEFRATINSVLIPFRQAGIYIAPVADVRNQELRRYFAANPDAQSYVPGDVFRTWPRTYIRYQSENARKCANAIGLALSLVNPQTPASIPVEPLAKGLVGTPNQIDVWWGIEK